MLAAFLFFCLVSATSADSPILHLSADCPHSVDGKPYLNLITDVPSDAVAKCKNGGKSLSSRNHVDFDLTGSFDQTYVGDYCLFYKKEGSQTYTVEVEIGWGEWNSQVINNVDIRTITCAYDDHGNAKSDSETISDWFLAPQEQQNLVSSKSQATFDLKIVNVLGKEVDHNHISIGRKIRLRATVTSKNLPGFRAISCFAQNGLSSYAILRAGCGDGLIFSRSAGFLTRGTEVFSPYFDAFKLHGGNNIQFQCNFTACQSTCDGDSCSTESRRRRAVEAEVPLSKPMMWLTSRREEHSDD